MTLKTELEWVTAKTEPISCGPIVFDAWSGTLRGPTGTAALQYNSRRLLLALMRWSMFLPEATLLQISYPEGTRQPRRPSHALRMRIMRIRAALARVGVPGSVLQSHYRAGYHLALQEEGSPMVFIGARAMQLEALLASHPDQTAVASLAQMPRLEPDKTRYPSDDRRA